MINLFKNNGKKFRSLQYIFFLGIFMLNVCMSFAQKFPPSCVITTPYNNAYFKAGTNVIINVYSTDIGKTTNNGTVTKVMFYNDKTLLGKATVHTANTFSFVWKNVPAGNYTIRAKAINNKRVSFTSTGVLITVGTKEVTPKGISANKGKYLANIRQRSESFNYDGYWNGVTSENACKWGSVEATRGNYQWEGADQVYNYAKENNMMFRFHAAIWASQYPAWLLTLTTEEAKAAIVNHLKTIAARYPFADQIDLLNEQLRNHQKDNQKFRDLLGGKGTKNDDFAWQIWLFEQGRSIFPNTKLVLNDYGLEGDRNAINEQLKLFKVLRDRGLVDGFGTQAHCFNVDRTSADTLKAHLDLMATAGIPIFVTELDMNGGIRGNQTNDSAQLVSFKKVIPVYWKHPSVAGITLWGYIQGSTWMSGTGIVSKSGEENPSMKWLKTYMSGQPDVGYPMSASYRSN